MTVPGKCCLCIKLSNGGIVLGSIGAFTSLVLVIVIGGVVLNYDNYVLQSYEKGQNDSDSYKLAQFLESYKNSEDLFPLISFEKILNSLFSSRRVTRIDLHFTASH